MITNEIITKRIKELTPNIPIISEETVDLKIYRDAENKDRNMANVEYLLKINAVDCLLNIHNNKLELNIIDC